MKIAILVWDLNVTGGTQRVAVELASNLQKQGHEVDVYCYFYDRERSYGELCDTLNLYAVQRGPGAPKAKSTRPSRAETLPKFLWNILKALNLYRVLFKRAFTRNRRIDELKALIEKNHPIEYYDIINVHDYGVHEISEVITHPHIVWTLNDVHRIPIESGFAPHDMLFNALTRLFAPGDVKNISKILVLDNRNKNLTKQVYNREAEIVRSGGNIDMFAGKTVPPHDSTQPMRIFASSIFFPYRRFEDLVDAVDILVKKGVTNISAVINGSPLRAPEYYAFIRERVIQKDLSRFITIKTGMSEDELKNQYLRSDIFVFASKVQTWGLAVFEGMLAGCATIVSRGVGAHEVLTDKENVLLVDPCAPQQIADAIEYLMTHPQEMQRIQENGVQFVRENLSWDKYARDMLTVFTQELEESV